jgi:hypothetical protein
MIFKTKNFNFMKLTKKLLKKISKEGISEDMILNCEGHSPVQLVKDEEPVSLIKCSSGYWVNTNEGFLKDEENQLIVITDLEAKIGRARYILNFQEEIEEKKIQKEIEILKKLTQQKVDDYLSKIKLILQLAGIIEESDLFFSLHKMSLEQNGVLENTINEAKEIASKEDYLYSYETIKRLRESENWNILYIYFFQNGLPEITRFELNDIEGLKKYFHRENIQQTIETIQSKEHLYNVAKFRVEKKH